MRFNMQFKINNSKSIINNFYNKLNIINIIFLNILMYKNYLTCVNPIYY